MASLDLQDAFFHVPIHKDFQKFLRFTVVMGSEVQHFQFSALPFGLSAPWVFTKLIAEVMAFLYRKRIRIVPYLDNFLIGNSADQVSSHLEFVWQNLLGWMTNFKKSDLVPSYSNIFQGILLNSQDQASYLPAVKQVNILSQISSSQPHTFPSELLCPSWDP